MTERPHVSRLAPSPTGALHLGNARTFLVNWALARREGWTLRMRMEDLDGPRIKSGAADAALDLLAWLGLDYDGPILVQSDDLDRYRTAMRTLAAAGHVYPCTLTRSEIEAAASAPHAGSEPPFPAALRPAGDGPWPFDEEQTNYRFRVHPGRVRIDDSIAGATTLDLADDLGDFVVWTKRGAPAYQLAVVIDDIAQGVTEVVRGDDLLPSAFRQEAIYRVLGAPPPRWWHVPLVIGRDGRRLAKRHGDTRVETYRAAGVPAERVVGLLAWWCGIGDRLEAMTAADFRDGFDPARLPRAPMTFREDDHAWLLGGQGG